MKLNLVYTKSTVFSLLLSLSLAAPASFASEAGPQVSAPVFFTPYNLNQLELISGLSKEKEVENEIRVREMEADASEQIQLFQDSLDSSTEMLPAADEANDVEISLYQEAPGIKWTFLVAKENGKIRYVFLTSPGIQGKSTPVHPNGVPWGVMSQAWRHTSTKYPTPKGNMDHVSYFAPLYGIHSTVLGAYHKLGQRDSHGCVRLGRPEARAIFRLIAKNKPKVKVYSYRKQSPPQEDLNEILTLLSLDLNFIQKELLARKNPGDVPFTTAKQYFEYKDLEERSEVEKVQEINKVFKIKFIREIYPEQDRKPAPVMDVDKIT